MLKTRGWLGILMALCLMSAGVAAASENVYVGAGMLTHNLVRTSTVYPAALLSGRIDVGGVTLAPNFGYTLISRSLADHAIDQDATTTSIITLGLSVAQLSGAFEPHGGLGVLFYKISGNGGMTQVPNTSSTTGTYSLPNRSETSKYLYLDLGAGYYFGKVRADLDFLISGVLSDRRAISVFLALSYGVW